MDPICYLCFMFVSHTVTYFPCSRVVTCWGRTDDFALFYVMFSCVFVTFPYGVLGQVWYLIVSILDICLLLYFVTSNKTETDKAFCVWDITAKKMLI